MHGIATSFPINLKSIFFRSNRLGFSNYCKWCKFSQLKLSNLINFSMLFYFYNDILIILHSNLFKDLNKNMYFAIFTMTLGFFRRFCIFGGKIKDLCIFFFVYKKRKKRRENHLPDSTQSPTHRFVTKIGKLMLKKAIGNYRQSATYRQRICSPELIFNETLHRNGLF